MWLGSFSETDKRIVRIELRFEVSFWQEWWNYKWSFVYLEQRISVCKEDPWFRN